MPTPPCVRSQSEAKSRWGAISRRVPGCVPAASGRGVDGDADVVVGNGVARFMDSEHVVSQTAVAVDIASAVEGVFVTRFFCSPAATVQLGLVPLFDDVGIAIGEDVYFDSGFVVV